MVQIIDEYIDRIIAESLPQSPVWNIESSRFNKPAAWNYIDGCMMTALFELYGISNDGKILGFIKDFIDYYVSDDGAILGYKPSDYNIDNISGGRILFDLFKIFGDSKYKKAIELLYSQLQSHPRTDNGSFWHKQIYPNQVWLDGLYMGQVFYTRYESEFNDCARYDDILLQFENVREHMFDAQKHLCYHGIDYSRTAFWANPKTGLSKSFWLRSMGWYICALADVLAYIKPSASHIVTRLSQLFIEAAEGLLTYVDPASKMLWQVIDRGGDAGNYTETSGSAMTAYALLKGARCGFLSREMQRRGAEIFNAICGQKLSHEGGRVILSDICLMAGLGPQNNRRRDGTYEYYISEPTVSGDAKGLAPFLAAYAEMKMIND